VHKKVEFQETNLGAEGKAAHFGLLRKISFDAAFSNLEKFEKVDF
jgi:hypothetical protein